MNKKPFDHIEERIREAAENTEPPFDEQAWANMELRLDNNDKRRRFLFWWFALAIVFIGGGSTLYFYNKSAPRQSQTLAKSSAGSTSVQIAEKGSGNNSSPDKNSATPPVTIPVARSKDNSINQATNTSKQVPDEAGVNIGAGSTEKSVSRASKKIAATAPVTDTKPNITGEASAKSNVEIASLLNSRNKKIIGSKKQKLSTKIKAGDVGDDNTQAKTESIDNTVSSQPLDKSAATPTFKKNDSTQISSVDTSVNDRLKKSVAQQNTIDSKKPQVNFSKKSRWYFLASVGGEVGSVKLFGFKNNPATLKYGAGIGYQLNRKLSVQTGFYAGTKKYVAGPGDYKAKAGSYWNMVQIVKVDAACLVYDIPVTLRYNFLQKNNITYFATTGISSYLMKKEDYYYYYVRNNMNHEGAYSYTGNKNLFSVLNFSAGIEKKISPVFSMLIEPSVSVPLSGVGDGSVRLFNTALQLGLKYQPFKKH